MTEEVLVPGATVADENDKTTEPAEKFVNLLLTLNDLSKLSVSTGTHAPDVDHSHESSEEDDCDENLSYDPGKDPTFKTIEVGSVHVYLPLSLRA